MKAMRNMTRSQYALGILAAMLVTGTPATGAVVERIAIRVNDRILTVSDIKQREDDMSRELVRSGVTGAELTKRLKDVKKQVAEEATKELLLLERAREISLTIDPADIEDTVGRMKKQNGINNDEELQKAVTATGVTMEQFKDSIRRNLTLQRLVGHEIQAKLEVTDEYLHTLYNNDKEKYRKPDQVHVSEILVLAPNPGDRAAAREKIETARKRILAGESFPAVAREVSEGGTKEKGGDLGIVTRGELTAEIDSVVFSLDQGSLSNPVESKFGIHLLRIDEKFPAAYTPFDEAKEKVRSTYQEAEYNKRLTEFIQKLREKYYVKIEAGEPAN